MIDLDALLGSAEDIVRKAVAAGADQAEAYLEQGASLDVEVEKDQINAGSMNRSRGGSVRVVKDGRLGFAYFSDTSDAPASIERALQNSRLAPEKGYHLPAVTPCPALGRRWDDALAALPADQATAWCRDMVQGAKEACPDAVVGGGGVSLAYGGEAIANSEGVSVKDATTHASAGASLLLAEGESAVNAWDSKSIEVGRMDAHALGAGVGRLVDSLRAPQEATAGKQDLVFLPDAVSELVTGVVASAVDGDRARRGKSVWSDALGTDVADAGFSIIDDPLHPKALGATPFDGEGMGALRVPIIEAGALKSFLFDSWDAHQHEAASTHSASRGGFKSPPSTGPHHLVVEHQTTLAQDDLVAGVDAGYLVESVLGAHTANPTTGDFSVTAANVWRIEAGAVVGASKEVAIGGNLPDLLRRLDAAGKEAKAMDGARVPALRFRDVQIST